MNESFARPHLSSCQCKSEGDLTWHFFTYSAILCRVATYYKQLSISAKSVVSGGKRLWMSVLFLG